MNRYTMIAIAILTTITPEPAAAGPKRVLTHRCAQAGEVSTLGACPITTPDENTCVPTCSPQRGGQWCTDCGQNGGAPSLDQDGRPTIVAELIDDGFACLLYSSDAETSIGDCEVYGWACHRGACVDSDGHRWATEEIPDPDCSAIITATVDVLACGSGMSWCERGGCHGMENPGCIYDKAAADDAELPKRDAGDLATELLDCFAEALASQGCSL